MKIACFTTPPEHKIIKINQFMDTPLLFAVCICFIIHTVYAAASARGHPCLMEISLLYNNTFTTTTEHLIMPPPKTTNPHFLLMALLYVLINIHRTARRVEQKNAGFDSLVLLLQKVESYVLKNALT